MQKRTYADLLGASFVALSLALPAVVSAKDPSADQYKVQEIYSGKTRLPQFKGRDTAFREFRTRITDGLKAGPDFAGDYSVIQFGCGTGCSMAMIASNRTGQVFDFPRGGEANMYMTLQYSKDSRLMTAQWASYDDNQCHMDFFEWKDHKAALISTRIVGPMDDCYNDINDNLGK